MFIGSHYHKYYGTRHASAVYSVLEHSFAFNEEAPYGYSINNDELQEEFKILQQYIHASCSFVL